MTELQKTFCLTLNLKEIIGLVLIIILIAICSYKAGENAELDRKVTQIERELADQRSDLDKLIYNTQPKLYQERKWK